MATGDDRLVVGFDLDMTLIDPRAGIVAALTALDAEIGAGIDVDWVTGNVGLPLEDLLAPFVPAAEVERTAWRYREIFGEVGLSTTTAMPGAASAVGAVRDAGGTVVVVTAKYEPHARVSLQVAEVEADVVVGWRFGPAKGGVLRSHGARIYVGDHPADVVAARAAGAVAVTVATGPASPGELAGAGADVVLESLEEFPAWLDDHRGNRRGA